jgi:proliferating cell nuclear antigen
MIKARMSDTKIWKTCVGSMVNLIEEAAFKFTPAGVKMRAMDPSHIALVDFELPPDAFAEYEVKAPTILGINLMEMNKVLSRAKPGDELGMEFDEKQNRLTLTFKGKSTRRLSLPLISMDEREFPEPKIPFVAEIEVNAGVVQDGLKDAELVTDNVQFSVDKESFVMRAEGDKGSTELKLSKDDKEALAKLKVDQPARAVFNIKYLRDMMEGASSSDSVTILLGTDLPVQLDFRISKGKLRFLLAPRIEAE